MNGNSKKLPSVILAMFLAMSACKQQDKKESPPEKENIIDIEKAVCHEMTYCRFFCLKYTTSFRTQ